MLAFCVEEKWRKLRNGFSILSGWYHASHLRHVRRRQGEGNLRSLEDSGEAAPDPCVDRRRWRGSACNARVPAQNSEGRVQGKRHRFRLRVELRSVALPRRDFLTAAAALYGAAAFLLSSQTDIFGLQHENHEQRKRRKKKCMDW